MFTICRNQFHFPKNDREGVKMAVSKMTLKKWNTNFRLDHSVRKNRATFSDVPLLSEICHWNDPTQKVVFHLTSRIFRKLFVNGKQLLFQNVILNLVSLVIAERNKGSRQIWWKPWKNTLISEQANSRWTWKITTIWSPHGLLHT